MAGIHATTTQRVSLEDFAAILQLDPRCNAATLPILIDQRLDAMGVRDLCRSCGGSGRQLLNPPYWRICPECEGLGYTPPPLTARTYERAVKAVAAGRLQAYLQRLELDRMAKETDRKVWQAWQQTGILSRYDWRKAVAHAEGRGSYPEDARLDQLNARMRNAYLAVAEVAGSFLCSRSIPRKRAMLPFLQQTAEEALQEIKAAAAEI